ncbi:hypothetical protein OQA88_3616 [Cercophora sp. LCS_1]
MESIQLAQMLADLSDLNAAQEAQAAVALVNANKSLSSNTATGAAGPTSDPSNKLDASSRPSQRDHQRVGSASSMISRTASPAKFDKFGRRILITPPLSRANSNQGSIPGTPRRDAEVSTHTAFWRHLIEVSTMMGREPLLTMGREQLEDDVDRANSLMQLYEIRTKVREQDNTSLMKLREKIAALQARQQAEKKDGSADARQSRFTYPKGPA